MKFVFIVPPPAYNRMNNPIDRVYGCNYGYDYKMPVHMLSAATVLEQAGHAVRFLDCPAEGWGAAQLLVGLLSRGDARLEERLAAEASREIEERGRVVLSQRSQEELPPYLARLPIAAKFHGVFRQTFPGASIVSFLLLTVLVGAAAFLAGLKFHSLVVGIAGGIVAMMIPFIVLRTRWEKRQRLLSEQLMDALDFLSRVLRAGHSLSTGFKMIGDELPDPVATEFRRCYDQNSLGKPIEQAMLEMVARVQSTDFAFFVTSVIIQRQTGGDLAALLDNISAIVRARVRLHQHTRALTAEGRFSGYILTALPPGLFCVLYFLNPAYAGQLLTDDTGRIFLLVAAALMLLGHLLIRKIVTVKV